MDSGREPWGREKVWGLRWKGLEGCEEPIERVEMNTEDDLGGMSY